MERNLSTLNHRSKKRIQDLGEVFTPESYVEEMLDLLAKDKKNFWSDEDIVFFEPCCGHGNIVLPIYKRRLEAIYKKAITQGFGKSKEAPLYAVANAINTLWAIDIDSENIENTRSRVLHESITFLMNKLNFNNKVSLISKHKEFFAHVMSALKWHIYENETLSALSTDKDAKANACLTKSGSKWLSKNGHHELDFDLTWVTFYESCERSKTVPLEHERSVKFIQAFTSGKMKGFEDFNFAKAVLIEKKNNVTLELGA
ncbi:MAG: hypothetical protein JNM93_01795 [Bacteriovoracaceae bacterium]|nr:hypothetical protein [Bacteriovoracaceae bacterium]